MSDDHPKEWAITRLGDLFEFNYGKGLTQENRNNKGRINVYGSNGVVGTHDAALTNGATIIIGRKGSVGEVHLSPHRCWAIDTTYFIDDFPCDLPPAYWSLFLKLLRLGQQDKSSAIPGISRKDIYEIEIAFPPLNEQRLLCRFKPKSRSSAALPVLRRSDAPEPLKRIARKYLLNRRTVFEQLILLKDATCTKLKAHRPVSTHGVSRGEI
jgi:hypothetical protein